MQVFRVEEIGVLSPWNPDDPKMERKRPLTKVELFSLSLILDLQLHL